MTGWLTVWPRVPEVGFRYWRPSQHRNESELRYEVVEFHPRGKVGVHDLVSIRVSFTLRGNPRVQSMISSWPPGRDAFPGDPPSVPPASVPPEIPGQAGLFDGEAV